MLNFPQTLFAIALLFIPSVSSWISTRSRSNYVKNTLKSSIPDDVFGSEMAFIKKNSTSPSGEIVISTMQLNGDIKKIKILPPEKRAEVMKSYDNARLTFIADSVFISLLGLSLTWCAGSFKDAYSYGLGSLLGIGYAVLLSRYVESVGSENRSKGGSLRFVPVILLIVLYGKFKTYVNIIPELLGFFSYQLGSFVQIFNENLYGDEADDDGVS